MNKIIGIFCVLLPFILLFVICVKMGGWKATFTAFGTASAIAFIIMLCGKTAIYFLTK